MKTALERFEASILTCRKCPCLTAWREEVAITKRRAYMDQLYWGKPVPGFGDPQARLMIIGLAPGAHGSNRTGRMFTGDASGNFLFPALYRAGFSNQEHAHKQGDSLILRDAFISAICRCVPPQNKPTRQEIANCSTYLYEEICLLSKLQGFVVLGRIAFDGILRLYKTRGMQLPKIDFRHGAFYCLGSGLPWLLCSYHPSRQNTQTGRLTESMFDAIWWQVRDLLHTQ
ncbi:MAG: uracil-DNA glycosylase [Chloroflexota bacterium]